MSSQKSSARSNAAPLSPLAVAPKRARGYLRVAAILDAAAALFAERGFEATTMTEVAVRSGTAIGSLYRFFPTKEAIAEALSQRYGEELGDKLDALALTASGLSSPAIADALVDLLLRRRRQRSAVAALLDRLDDGDQRRTALRVRILNGLVAILRAAGAGATPDDAAQVVLQLLKGVSRLSDEVGEDHKGAMIELRRALTLYVEDLRDRVSRITGLHRDNAGQ